MKKTKEPKPIDISKFNITETGQVLKCPEEEKMETKEVYLKIIEWELEGLKKEYNISDKELINIKQAIDIIREERYEKKCRF